MSAYQILAMVFTILLVVYFIEIFGVLRATKAGYPEFWREIGSPDIASPNGQMTFLAFVFGKKGYPAGFAESLKRKCIRLRFYLIAGFIVFALLIVALQIA